MKNTDWVFGVVLYTGKETKVLMNAGRQPNKRSRIERIMNKILIGLLFFLIALSVLSAGLNVYWEQNHTNEWYLPEVSSYALNGFLDIFTFMLLYGGIIPLALYVTIECIIYKYLIFFSPPFSDDFFFFWLM